MLMDSLFDISKKNIESLIKSDTDLPRSKDAIQEDIDFLHDQRSNRKWFICNEQDKDVIAKVERRIERNERMESLMLTEKERI